MKHQINVPLNLGRVLDQYVEACTTSIPLQEWIPSRTVDLTGTARTDAQSGRACGSLVDRIRHFAPLECASAILLSRQAKSAIGRTTYDLTVLIAPLLPTRLSLGGGQDQSRARDRTEFDQFMTESELRAEPRD